MYIYAYMYIYIYILANSTELKHGTKLGRMLAMVVDDSFVLICFSIYFAAYDVRFFFFFLTGESLTCIRQMYKFIPKLEPSHRICIARNYKRSK